MDNCYDKHDHKYLITYRPAKNTTRSPKWVVCESCYGTRKCFNNQDEIESITFLSSV